MAGRRACALQRFGAQAWQSHGIASLRFIRGLRLALENVLGMLAAGDTPEKILEGYPF
jgi:hypothetical protein